MSRLFFFFNDTATTEIYTLSLHDALPISHRTGATRPAGVRAPARPPPLPTHWPTPMSGSRSLASQTRSEEHTSELQSRQYLVCRLLLEKKKSRSFISSFGSSTRVLLYPHL